MEEIGPKKWGVLLVVVVLSVGFVVPGPSAALTTDGKPVDSASTNDTVNSTDVQKDIASQSLDVVADGLKFKDGSYSKELQNWYDVHRSSTTADPYISKGSINDIQYSSDHFQSSSVGAVDEYSDNHIYLRFEANQGYFSGDLQPVLLPRNGAAYEDQMWTTIDGVAASENSGNWETYTVAIDPGFKDWYYNEEIYTFEGIGIAFMDDGWGDWSIRNVDLIGWRDKPNSVRTESGFNPPVPLEDVDSAELVFDYEQTHASEAIHDDSSPRLIVEAWDDPAAPPNSEQIWSTSDSTGTARVDVLNEINDRGLDSMAFNFYVQAGYAYEISNIRIEWSYDGSPTANPVSVTTDEDKEVSGTFDADDPEGSSLDYSIVTDPSHGSVGVSGNQFTYTPDANYYGSDSFTYQVTDSDGNTDKATVDVTVNDVNDPPVADAGGPYSVDEGGSVELDASGSSDAKDPNGHIVDTSWSIVDGPGYISGGTYYAPDSISSDTTATVRVTVTDDDGATDSATATVDISHVPEPPTASFTYSPSSPTEGETVSFDASGSSDPDGDIRSYHWDFGNGATETGKTVSNTYSSPGDYTVTLTVEDSTGRQDTVTKTVSVGDAQESPSASFTYSPSNPTEGETVSFDASESSDPNGDIQRYEWDFGDGNMATGQFPSHAYSSSGDYTVTLTVEDSTGRQDTVTKTVSVGDAQESPSASFTYSPSNPTEGETVSFDASESSDPNGDIQRYEWDFGDGNTATGQFPSHAYSSSGDYTVTLTVIDSAGNSDTTTVTVPVASSDGDNDPPTADAGPDRTIDEGTSVTLDGTGSSDPDGDALNYSWTQTGGPTVSLDGATTATPTFTALAVDSTTTLTFELTVSDGNGHTDTDSMNLTVEGSTEDPIVVDTPAQDLDGDGLYEDVNGDGTFDIVDVNAFFQHYESAAVQNHVDLFDFNGDGKVDIIDVNALFQLFTQ